MDAEVSLAVGTVTMATDPNKLSRICPDNEQWGAKLTCPVLSPSRQLIIERERQLNNKV